MLSLGIQSLCVMQAQQIICGNPMNYPDSNQMIFLQDAYGVFNIYGDNKEISIFSSFVTIKLIGSHNQVCIIQSQVEMEISGNFNKVQLEQSLVDVRFNGQSNQVKSFGFQNSNQVNVKNTFGSNNVVLFCQKQIKSKTNKVSQELNQENNYNNFENCKEDTNQSFISNFAKQYSQDQTNQGQEPDFRSLYLRQTQYACREEEVAEATKMWNIFRFGKNQPSVIKNFKIQKQLKSEEDFKIVEHQGHSCICSACSENIYQGEDKMVLGCSHQIHLTCITDWLQKSENCHLCSKN